MPARVFPAADETVPDPSDPRIGLAPAPLAAKTRQRSSGKRSRTQQPKDPWAGFKTGFATGSFVSLSAGFVLLGIWFRSEEGGNYRPMLGQPAISANGAHADSTDAPRAIAGTDEGQKRARSRLSIPMWTPTDPARPRILDPGTEDRTPGAIDRSAQGASTADAESGSVAARAARSTSTNATRGAVSMDNRGSAQDPHQRPGTGKQGRNRFDRRPRPIEPAGSAGQHRDNPEQDLGIEALMKNHEHNRKTIGQATSLLKALGGE